MTLRRIIEAVKRPCLFAGLCFLFGMSPAETRAQQGTRPRNLVARSDGTVLATSMGSNDVTQLTWNGSSFDDPLHIDIGGKSWGACLTDDDTAVVSLPFAGQLVVLTWQTAVGRWQKDRTIIVPHYCTDVIANPVLPSHVFVANRGAKSNVPNAQEWQHAVYEVDVDAGFITRTLVTDREPRALALSPDGRRLFVAHIQGALGGPAWDATTGTPIIDHPLSNPIYDGGSVIVFDVDNSHTNPVYRFGVGSPVRGVAVVPVDGGQYRVFFTHVGHGAASEDPQFGGRDIANIITSIAFDATTNEPVGTDPTNPLHRQDFVFGHAPDNESRTAILHEKLTVRHAAGRRELWVANSGSGTVTRLRLGATGRVDSDGQVSIRFPIIQPGVPRAAGGWLLDANMTTAQANFETVALDIVRSDSVTHFLTGAIGSNPRAVIYDNGGGRDRLLVATQLSHTVVQIDPGTSVVVSDNRLQPVAAPNPVIPDEINFFTFGRGFDFREGGIVPGARQKTNNFTCGTCHVDGHIDGKIRFTVRVVQNVPINIPSGSMEILGAIGKPVHVATAFDMGSTEWMFFEGLKTIRDGIDPREPHTTGAPDTRCGYCLMQVSGFFFDTDLFTRHLSSPMSPHAPDGVLSRRQNEGRLLFEAMNCSRCHVGATRQTFPRTQEEADNLPPNDPDFAINGQFGPTPGVLETENRLLHDPAQIVFKNDLRVCPPRSISSELMNMTNVGTRQFRDGVANGINTPALAGAWDNRPYMHDGRYRTLADVLRNTWLNRNDALRAALLVFEGVADNANGGAFPGDPCEMTMSAQLFPFNTHKQYPGAVSPPTPLVSVYDYLTSLGKLDEVIDFLSAVSAQTDLCAGEGNIPAVLVDPDITNCTSTFTWQTTVPSECRVLWGLLSQDPPPNEIITPLGTHHTVNLPTFAQGDYRIRVAAYTRGLCAEQLVVEKTWTVNQSLVRFDVDPPSIFACPQGDADTLVVHVALNMIGTIAPSRLEIGPTSGGDIFIFPGSSGVIEADSAATDANGHNTTITLVHFSGSAADPGGAAIPILLDGLPLGCAYVVVRSPDLLPRQGRVGLSDLAEFAFSHGKCAPDVDYREQANFFHVDRCVDDQDFALFAAHYLHEKPGVFGPSLVELPLSRIEVELTRGVASPLGIPVELRASNLQGVSAFEMTLEANAAVVERVDWIPNSTLGSATLLVRKGNGESADWVFAATGVDGWGDDVATLGRFILRGVSESTGASDGVAEAPFALRASHVLTESGASEQIARLGFGNVIRGRRGVTNALAQNHPNPFNPTTSIGYSIQAASQVHLAIYNVKGERVRTLVNENQQASEYLVTWDGRDAKGNSVATGVYFYRLRTPSFAETRKMIILR